MAHVTRTRVVTYSPGAGNRRRMSLRRDLRGGGESPLSSTTAHLRTGPEPQDRFEDVVLPHLDAAYRLARWLVRNKEDAEDVVQDACVRALRYFRTFTGGNGRAWFLRIVRNTCWSRHGQRIPVEADPFDEERHGSDPADAEIRLIQLDEAAQVRRTLERLPDRFRELLVLRELEGLTYRELADVIGVPIGTIMSSLSRARQAFRHALEGDRAQPCGLERKGVREQELEDELAETTCV